MQSRAIGFAVLLTYAAAASAELGGDAAVSSYAAAPNQSVRTTNESRFTVQETQTAAGTIVREYVSPQGKIFAISWSGEIAPDIKQLFGAYYDRYVAESQKHQGLRAPVVVNTADLVVYSSGHLRTLYGKAYVPQLLPPNVTLNDIQ